MHTHSDKSQPSLSQANAENMSRSLSEGDQALEWTDNRPEAVAQRELQKVANNSAGTKQLSVYQAMADNSTRVKQQQNYQAMADNKPATIQPKKNNTGLSDHLKSGVENLSGYSMDDVKVHYNSDKPAQLEAHAYAQGTEIHVAPGQEKHVPHEAWHVVQQKQGRVNATFQMKGTDINDDVSLEQEADTMGSKSLTAGVAGETKNLGNSFAPGGTVSQRVVQLVRRNITERLLNSNKINGPVREAFIAWLKANNHTRVALKAGEDGISVNSDKLAATLISMFKEEYEKSHVEVKPMIAHVGQGLYAVATSRGDIQGLQTSGAATCVAVAFSDTKNKVFAVGHIDPAAKVAETVFGIYDGMVDAIMKELGVVSFADANVEIANNTKIVVATSGHPNAIIDLVVDAIGRVFRGEIVKSGSDAAHATAGGAAAGESATHADFIKTFVQYEADLSVVPPPMLKQMHKDASQLVRTLRPQSGDREFADKNYDKLRGALIKIEEALKRQAEPQA